MGAFVRASLVTLLTALLLQADVSVAERGSTVSVVGVVHSSDFLTPVLPLTPGGLYPLGRLDVREVSRLLDRAVPLAVGAHSGEDAWRFLADPSDKVGILVDAHTPPASLALVDLVVDRLVQAGTRPGNIIVWADSEKSLFRAGVMLGRGHDGVSTMGADAEGYAHGTSRIVVSYCRVLINVARLRADSRIGMWGATANLVACVSAQERQRLLSDQRLLPSAAARPAVRLKARLHIIDALQPNYEPGPVRMPPYWNCGTLLASKDSVATDVVAKGILEEKRAEVAGVPRPLEPEPTYLSTAATAYRVGQADPASITVLHEELR